MSSLETRKTTISDFDFIYSLHRQTLYAFVEQTWGHKEDFQRNGMRKDFDTLPFEIVCTQGEDIGAISVVDEENAFTKAATSRKRNKLVMGQKTG